MPGKLTQDVKARLKSEVGDANYTEEFFDVPTIHLETYADVSSNREMMAASNKVAVRPADVESIRRIMKVAQDERVPVIPLGGATTFFVSGGAVPVRDASEAIIVDLRRMDRVLDLDKESGTVTVEAGITIERLNAFLKEHGLWYPHHPESRNAATVGGAISVNGISPFATKYGQPGELLVALKVVLPDGKAYQIGNKTTFENIVKMADIFVGTEGSFGLIAEATLKVYPTPATRIKKLYGFKQTPEACAAVAEIASAGLAPEALMVSSVERIYNEAMLTILSSINAQEVLEGRESFIFVTYAGQEELVSFSVARTGEIIDRYGGAPIDDLIVESYWRNLMEFGAVVTPQMSSTYGGRKYNSLRGGIPLRSLPEFIALEKKAIPLDDRSRLIDDGVSAYVLLPDLEAIPICGILLDDTDATSVSEFNAWLDAVCRVYKTLGGTISASVGAGTLLRDHVALDMGESREVATRLRDALDPHGLMNPGKIFPHHT